MQFAASRNIYNFSLTVWSRYTGNLLKFAIASLYPFAAFDFITHFWAILVMGIFHFSPNLFVAVTEKCCSGKEEAGKLEGRWCWKERGLRALIQLLLLLLHRFLSNHKCVLCSNYFPLQLLYFPVKWCGSCTEPKWQSGKEFLLRTWWHVLIFAIKTCRCVNFIK